MKMRIVIALLVVSTILSGAGSVAAQPYRPPTIFLFSSNIPSVTMTDLESGNLTITLGWHVAHVDSSHSLRLYAYQGYGWILLHDETQGLPAVGNLTVPLEHPGNFGPPTYKIVILDSQNVVIDERTLVIPFDRADATAPTIDTFMTETQSIAAGALASGEQVVVTWRVSNRPPQTNLIFEQVMDSDQVQNVELPRALLWVPSAGTGAVVPVQSPDESVITLRLSLLDVITAHVYDEKTLTISVTGAAIPPASSPEVEASAVPPEPTLSTQFGSLMISTLCTTMGSSTSPDRAWVDGDGIRSPDQRNIAYATNALGDAKLIVSNADGSGQVAIDVPDKAFPLWIRPSWSPDGEWIAFSNFVLSQPGGGSIYVVRRDGSDLREIASYTGYHDDLAWSEDGTMLYFTSGVASGSGSGTSVGDYTVYVVAANGLGAPSVVAAGCLVRP